MSGTQATAQIDQLLTNVSNKIVPKGYICEMILPLITVAQYTGLIGKHGNEHLRIINSVAGGKKGYAQVESGTRGSTSYHIQTHALKDFVTQEDYRNVIKPFDAEKDVTNKLITHIWLGKEKSLADALADDNIITQNVVLSGTDQYSDYDNSDPIGDVDTAKGVIEDGTGMEPNIMVMNAKVMRKLKYHPQLLDKLGYKESRPGGLTEAELADAFDVEKVLVGRAVYNASNVGQADNIQPVWGNHITLMYVPDSASLDQVSAGYRLQLSGQSPRQVFKTPVDEPIGAKKIIVKDEYEQLLSDLKAIYLIKNAI